MKIFSNSELDEIKKSPNAIIDFFADWCGPCKIMAPEFEKAAAETDILCGKINVDECEAFAVENKIQYVPTVIYFCDGTEKDRFVGPKTKEQILDFINKNKK